MPQKMVRAFWAKVYTLIKISYLFFLFDRDLFICEFKIEFKIEYIDFFNQEMYLAVRSTFCDASRVLNNTYALNEPIIPLIY